MLNWIFFLPGSVTLQNTSNPYFKFKNKTNDDELVVKTPLTTCTPTNDSLNLPSGEFLLSSLFNSQPLQMQRKVTTFSSPTKNVKPKPLHKPPKLKMLRKLNHDPNLLAAHREDRCFRSKHVWILPLRALPRTGSPTLRFQTNPNCKRLSRDSDRP